MQLHEIQRNTSQRVSTRVGRGGKRGKTSGRGMKGQKSRAGHRIRPEMRDIIKKIPKLRGHGKNRARTVHSGRVRPVTVNLRDLNRVYSNGDTVSPQTLVEKDVLTTRRGKAPVVKILGNGDIALKLTVNNCELSKIATEKLTKAGGTVSA